MTADPHRPRATAAEISIWIAGLIFSLCFPVVSIVAAIALAVWKMGYRPIPYDLELPHKSKYLEALKPPAQDPDPEDVCAHCRDQFVSPLELRCGHVFCTECVKSHIEYKQSRCPLCYWRPFNPIQPSNAQFVHMGFVSTAVAVLMQSTAMIMGYFWPGNIDVNPWPLWYLANIGEMSALLWTPAIMGMTFGKEWMANVLSDNSEFLVAGIYGVVWNACDDTATVEVLGLVVVGSFLLAGL